MGGANFQGCMFEELEGVLAMFNARVTETSEDLRIAFLENFARDGKGLSFLCS